MKRPQESGRRRSTTRRDFLKRSAVAASATHIARYAHAALWRCRIRYEDGPGVVVPYNTDGKARCERLELLEEMTP